MSIPYREQAVEVGPGRVRSWQVTLMSPPAEDSLLLWIAYCVGVEPTWRFDDGWDHLFTSIIDAPGRAQYVWRRSRPDDLAGPYVLELADWPDMDTGEAPPPWMAYFEVWAGFPPEAFDHQASWPVVRPVPTS